MVNFKIESWAAVAPGLETREDWNSWLQHPVPLPGLFEKSTLGGVPPLLRRRFGTLGKSAMKAALQILDDGERIPSVFSSRHGDTAITLPLLAEMGSDEPMSPTNFSLAVHNAVGGLFSIVRKDTNMVTSLAAVEGLVLHTLLEAVGQLQVSERVLCVIYDIPLPELYRRYCTSNDFPYAIALIISRVEGASFSIEQCDEFIGPTLCLPDALSIEMESFRFLQLLTGMSMEMGVEVNGGNWRIAKTA